MRYYNFDEQLLKLIAATINDIIAIHGLDGEIRYVSPSVQKVLGYSPEELIGTSNLDYCHPEEAPAISEILAGVRAGRPRRGSRFEHRYLCKDGSCRWLEAEVSRIADAAGKTVELLVISRDITARKKMEQELLNSCEQLALALDGAKAGVVNFVHDPGVSAVYRQWWEILGYTAEEAGNMPEDWLSLCHPEDREMLVREGTECLAGRREKIEVEYRIRHKNGSYRWVLGTGKMMADIGGEPRLTGLLIDITDLKELAAKQRESETRLRDFAQAIPDVSMIVDECGRYIEIFGPNDKLLPLPYEELKRRKLHQVLPAREADFLLSIFRRVIQTGRPQEFSVDLLLRGQRKYLEARVAPMHYLADGMRTVAVVLTDVSEKRRAERLMEFTLALRRRSSFIDDVVDGKIADAEAVSAAKAFGVDLAAPLFCCVVHVAGQEDEGVLPESSLNLLNGIIELLSSMQNMFVWDCHGDIGVLIGDAAGGGDAADTRVAEQILGVIAAREPKLKVAVGVGCRLGGPEGIRRSCRQAAVAVLVARSQDAPRRVCHFRDIGIYKFLANFHGDELAKEYIQETLGKLIEYDRLKGAHMMRTLEVMLESVSLKEAAQKLFMHYNTAVRHKNHIERLLGVSIEDIEAKLALAEAIKLRKLGL